MRKDYLFIFSLCFFCFLSGCFCSVGNQHDKSINTVIVSPAPSVTIEQPNDSSANRMESSICESPNVDVESIALTPMDYELVRIAEFIPELYVDLQYATSNNFTGEKIYYFEDAWLRYGTVKKLQVAQNTLSELGYSLKIWDAYRPTSAQFKLWELVPNSTYVANPYTGFSAHSNGGTLDLTLVCSDGTPLEMPSAFDEFSTLADRNYSDVSDAARENALILEDAMEKAGFKAYYYEWWHYSDSDIYLYEDVAYIRLPLNVQIKYEPDCEEYISMREAPYYDARTIEKIPIGASFSVFGWAGEFARIEFNGKQGYVATDYIKMIVS